MRKKKKKRFRWVDKAASICALIIQDMTALFRDREMKREMKTTYFAYAKTLLLNLLVVTDTKDPFYLGWLPSAEKTQESTTA